MGTCSAAVCTFLLVQGPQLEKKKSVPVSWMVPATKSLKKKNRCVELRTELEIENCALHYTTEVCIHEQATSAKRGIHMSVVDMVILWQSRASRGHLFSQKNYYGTGNCYKTSVLHKCDEKYSACSSRGSDVLVGRLTVWKRRSC